MALSNIGREPRREITEQVVGTLAIVLYCVGDYLIVTRLFGATALPDVIFGTLIFGTLFLVAVIGGTLFAHAIGELVCEVLQSLGIDPRPRQRY